MGLFSKILGDYNTKEIKRIEKIADQVDALESTMAALPDAELQAKTAEFRRRIGYGLSDEEKAAGRFESLDDILPEAFAVCREASARVLGMKHFRVQVIGGVVLHEGNIAEMKTGEGKTLVATLPVYLNALEGKGVHVVTVNDYLAKRDCEWMGQIYTFLGLTVGCVIHDIDSEERKAAYNADITYGTNNEFGFDYLRDNMVTYREAQMQRPLNYAIVDEVDSILIDEARTPLIISGVGAKSSDLYQQADRFVRTLTKGEIIKDGDVRFGGTITETGDYTVDEKEKTSNLTAQGIEKAERYFGIENFADPENMEINHHVHIALKAHAIMRRDVDYIEKDGEIVIVDEFTGRFMFGRRYSDGLHQAIEAKEGIEVRSESRTLATITLQNYFRMYTKLAGMTGTAKTEEDEFSEIYNMNVVEIPTNKPVIRQDLDDSVYANQKAKIRAIVASIEEHHATGQPVLVGTVSVEKSELLSEILKKRGIKHNVLNAKQHMREAEIVAEAGKKNAVTIATNMAGRGTDIILGGSDATPEEQEEVKALGGLHIIGTERHEARRIDNQLRGRSGRQGDPGSSQFFVALDDDLMRLFGGERVQLLMERLGAGEEALEAGMLSKSIESAQKKVEGRNFGIRKYVLQYDDVMNRQRSVIYAERNRVLHGESLREHIVGMMKEIADEIGEYVAAGGTGAIDRVKQYCPQFAGSADSAASILEGFEAAYAAQEQTIGVEQMREIERMLLLRIVDTKWMDHIDDMDQLKTGIGLRSIGQQNPAQAYANEGGEMFDQMVANICDDMVKFIFRVSITTNTERRQVIRVAMENKQDSGSALDDRPKEVKEGRRDPVHVQKTPGRNDPCPCGSGKKYKNCCGRSQ